MPERRFHLRVPLRVPVVIVGRHRYRAEATGLSRGGMAVRAEGLAQGEKVFVAMNLPTASSAPIVVDALVAHVSKGVAGLTFDEIPPEDAQAIEQFVWDSLSPGQEAPAPELPASAGILSVRVPLDVPVELVRSRGSLAARASGLSSTGVAVVSDELTEGEEVEVRMTLPGGGRVLRLPGVTSSSRSGVAGVRFLGLSRRELRAFEEQLWGYLSAEVLRNGRQRPGGRAGRDETPTVLRSMDETASAGPVAQKRRTCEIPGCNRPHKARGLCTRHYNRFRRRAR